MRTCDAEITRDYRVFFPKWIQHQSFRLPQRFVCVEFWSRKTEREVSSLDFREVRSVSLQNAHIEECSEHLLPATVQCRPCHCEPYLFTVGRAYVLGAPKNRRYGPSFVFLSNLEMLIWYFTEWEPFTGFPESRVSGLTRNSYRLLGDLLASYDDVKRRDLYVFEYSPYYYWVHMCVM